MATCNVNTLMRDASCFTCLPPGYYYPIKLALLARWLKSLNPTADTSVQGLMNQGQCFSCLPPGQWYPLRLALLCRIMSGQGGGGGGGGITPNPPTNLDISDASTNTNTILTWTQGSAPTTNDIYVSVNGGAFNLLASLAGALTTYTDGNGLNNGDVNQYKVRAVTGGNPSAYSNTVSVGSEIVFNGTADVSFSYPDMVHVYADFLFQNLASCTSISAPVLRIVEGACNATSCPVLTTLNISALKTCAGFAASGNTLLTTLSLPVFTNPGSVFDISSSGYTSVSLPSMTTCGGDFVFSSCPNLTSIAANSLSTVSGDFIGNLCVALTAFNMTTLATVGGSFLMTNSALTSVNLTGLTSLGGDFILQQSASLATLTIPNLIFPNAGNSIALSNCALNVASVDLVLHRGVVSGNTTNSFFLDAGTNAPPTNDCNPGSDCDTLTNAGNTVLTN